MDLHGGPKTEEIIGNLELSNCLANTSMIIVY
jgi:hypothetical protein